MTDFPIDEYEQLIDITSDSVLEQMFSIIFLSNFLVSLTEIFKSAVRKLL